MPIYKTGVLVPISGGGGYVRTNEMTGVKYLAQDLTHSVLWLTTKLDDRKVIFLLVWF